MAKIQDDGIVKLSKILAKRRDEYREQLKKVAKDYPLVAFKIALMEAALFEVEGVATLANKLGRAQLVDPDYDKEVLKAKAHFECLQDGGTWTESGRCVQTWLDRPDR